MPRINKTKEEIVKGLKDVKEVKRMRSFVKDKFYPQLLTASSSIDDAKFLLTSLANMLMDKFLSQMKEKKFKELSLETMLDPAHAKHEEYLKILKLFEDENVYVARELIEGMRGEIEMMINAELKERKLETLKTNFLE